MNYILGVIKEYLAVIIFGALIAFAIALKRYDEAEGKTIHQKIRHVVHSFAISMFLTWLGYEVFLYAHLPQGLSVALGGGFAFVGAERLVVMLDKFIDKKL